VKRVYFLIVAAAAVFCWPSSARADNLILNHGFERNLYNWASNPDPNVRTSWVGVDATGTTGSGSGAVGWNGGSFPSFNAGGLVQFTPVVGGATYNLSGSANRQSGSTGGASLVVIWKRADATAIRNDGLPLALQSGVWIHNGQNFTAPSDALGAEVILTLAKVPGNVVLFDDILLKGPRPAVASATASFTAIPVSIRPGIPALLTWSFSGATSVTIDQGIGTKPAKGSVLVNPTLDTIYTLTATSSSDGSVATAFAFVHVLTDPIIHVVRFTKGMFEPPNTGGATTSYTLVNEGGSASAITLTQNGDFFSQAPSSFTIPPGGEQIVTITGKAMAHDGYRGASLPAGNGVHPGLKVPVSLHVTNLPAAPVSARAATTRVDVGGAAATATGSATFTNTGLTALEGVLVADVPWIVPDPGLVTIPPGGSTKVSFAIDRTQRPDADSPTGSVSGTLSLFFPNGTAASSKSLLDTPPLSGTSLVGAVVSDTPQSKAALTSPPPLADGEVALILPGVGHVVGSGGKEFISDVSVLNSDVYGVDDMKMYYTSSSASLGSAQPVSSNTSLTLADVVTTYFGQDNQVGTLQIRSKDAEKLSVNASVFNKSNPKGTYGTAIPVLRSDRSTGPGETMVLGGLRKDSTAHTNLYLQEMSGTAAVADVTFMDAGGNTIQLLSGQPVPAFGLLSLNNVAPSGAVAAKITDVSGGTLSGYATPVDDASGDTWAVADWNQQSGFSGAEPMLIPVAGAAPGANGTNFRTDVAIMNIGVSGATAALTYSPASGGAVTKTLTLAPNETKTLDDVVPGFFGVTGVSVGSVSVVPASGSFNVTSRTYTKSGSDPATYGTGVPTLPISSALNVGDSRVFGGVEDSMTTTVASQRGGTFRTNFALVETAGKSAIVQVSVYFADGMQLTSGQANGSKNFTVGPNQYLQVNGVVQAILGSSRETSFGDLHNVEVRFDVMSGDGAVVPFVTSTDNGTGDTVLRTQ